MSVRNVFTRRRRTHSRSDSQLRAKWRPKVESLETRLNPSPYLLVSDGAGGSALPNVYQYSAVDGTPIGAFVGPRTDLSAPDLGMTLSPDSSYLLVDGFGSNNVARFNLVDGSPAPADGQTGAVFVPRGSGGLVGTEGMSFGPDGNLYVANDMGSGATMGPGNVLVYDGNAGTLIGTFVANGVGGMSRGNKLLWGPDGNLYVDCAYADGSVLRFDPSGNPLPSGSRSGAGFTDPVPGYFANGFSFDQNGNLIVAEVNIATNLAQVFRYDTNGDPLPGPGQSGAVLIPPGDNGLQFVDDIAVDVNNVADGNLYVTDETISATTNRVQEYDVNSGTFIGTFVQTGSGGLNVPGGLLFYDIGTAPGAGHGHTVHHTSSGSIVAQASIVSPKAMRGQGDLLSLEVQPVQASTAQASAVSLAQQTQTSQSQSTITPTALQQDAIDSVFAPASSVQGITMDGLDLSPI